MIDPERAVKNELSSAHPATLVARVGRAGIILPEKDRDVFPHLIGLANGVPTGGYEVVNGSNASIVVAPSMLEMHTPDIEEWDMLQGVCVRGTYHSEGESIWNVVSFLYHKTTGRDGQLETKERLIVLTGIGYGEHPGHPGQPPTWYMVGPQIGTHDPARGTNELAGLNTDIAPKHFSVACITGGPLGDPMLANPN